MNNQGFSLIEFIVSSAIAVILVQLLTHLTVDSVVYNKDTKKHQQLQTKQNEIRQLLQTLGQSIGTITNMSGQDNFSTYLTATQLIKSYPIVLTGQVSDYLGPVSWSNLNSNDELVINTMTYRACNGSYIKNAGEIPQHYVNQWYIDNHTLRCKGYSGNNLYVNGSENMSNRSVSWLDNVVKFNVWVGSVSETWPLIWTKLNKVNIDHQVMAVKFELSVLYLQQELNVTHYVRVIK